MLRAALTAGVSSVTPLPYTTYPPKLAPGLMVTGLLSAGIGGIAGGAGTALVEPEAAALAVPAISNNNKRATGNCFTMLLSDISRSFVDCLRDRSSLR